MEIDIDSGIPVMELDLLIRRALQDHFSEIQPPVAVWGSIQRQLLIGNYGILGRLTRGLDSGSASTPTRRSDKG